MAEDKEQEEELEAEAAGGEDYLRVGDRLIAERRSQGIDLTTVAERTRVPIRHLEAIEKSDFANLPGATYTLGFARSYARTLGLDASEVSSQLRAELAESGNEGYNPTQPSYEPTDPLRVPPRLLAWSAAGIAALLLIGYLVWRSFTLDGSVDDVVLAQEDDAAKQAEEAAAAQAEAETPDPQGEVVLTANDTVWVRIYDDSGKRLFEKEMQKGDRYSVPKDADNPQINTGRAQAIDVTVGGQRVDPLGPADLPILDVGVSADALIARGKEEADDISDGASTGGNNGG